MFLVYEGDLKRELKVSCYTDAGYLTDADDLKSQTGYVFVLNGGAVDWKSAKQSIFATSSAEAEYIAAFDASKEAVWVRKFISGLTDPFTKALAFPKHSEHTMNIGMLPASSLMQTTDIPLDLRFFRKHPSTHQCHFLKTLVIDYHIGTFNLQIPHLKHHLLNLAPWALLLASRATNASTTPWSINALSWASVTGVVLVVIVGFEFQQFLKRDFTSIVQLEPTLNLVLHIFSFYDMVLGNNSLNGTLPDVMSASLINIDLSYNEMSGTLTSWVNASLQLNLVVSNFTLEGSKNRIELFPKGFPL
nr:retrotransposon protein, putative, Ty1-copia subclass [Tanacetum cinerariifolium]